MQRYVALLRGINIGPKKRIRMDDLRALVEGIGHAEVKTYVNSGNVVFSAGGDRDNLAIAERIEAALMSLHNLDVPVVVRSGVEMAHIVANNPFPEHAIDYKTLHVSFLSEEPSAPLVEALADVERGDDDYRVAGGDIYLHYPNGVAGAVFMVNGFDKALKVASTSRNWRTVLNLTAMVTDHDLQQQWH